MACGGTEVENKRRNVDGRRAAGWRRAPAYLTFGSIRSFLSRDRQGMLLLNRPRHDTKMAKEPTHEATGDGVAFKWSLRAIVRAGRPSRSRRPSRRATVGARPSCPTDLGARERSAEGACRRSAAGAREPRSLTHDGVRRTRKERRRQLTVDAAAGRARPRRGLTKKGDRTVRHGQNQLIVSARGRLRPPTDPQKSPGRPLFLTTGSFGCAPSGPTLLFT